MDIKEEAQKMGSTPLRYAILFIGLCLMLLSQSVLTWKTASSQDARGQIDAIQLEIKDLEREIEDSSNSGDKKDMRDEIKDLKEVDLVDARLDAEAEGVDARTDIWITSMVKMGGLVLASFGLLIVATVASTHERIGALVALGFIITRL